MFRSTSGRPGGQPMTLLTVNANGTSGLLYQVRTTGNGSPTTVASVPNIAAPIWLRLVRNGTSHVASYSTNGTTWTAVGSTTVDLGSTIYGSIAFTPRQYRTVGQANFSQTSFGATLAAPGTPTATLTGGQVTLDWTPAWEASSYQVQRATASGGPFTTIATGVDATTFTDSTVTSGTTYYYKVQGVRLGVVGPDSGVRSVVPTAPLVVTINTPAANATFVQGNNLTVNVSATGGTISNVKLSVNGVLMHQEGIAPYDWSATSDPPLGNLAAGLYDLVVTATASNGNTGTATRQIAVGLADGSGFSVTELGTLSSHVFARNTGPNAYSLQAAGAGFSGAADNGGLLAKTFSGDGMIVARVDSLANVDVWTKAGITFRASTQVNAANVALLATPTATNGVMMQTRATDGAATTSAKIAGLTPPQWLKLVRRGSSFIGSYSANGVEWTQHTSSNVTLPTAAVVGLAITSHVSETSAQAAFSQVMIAPLPAVPTNLTVTPGNQQMQLAWTSSAGSESYVVKRATNQAGPFSIIATVAGTSFLDTSVTNGTTYYYTVSGQTLGEQGPAITSAAATPSGPLTGALTWDADGVFNNGTTGGTGTWDATNARWDNGAADGIWPNTNPNADTAVFSGTAGTVTLSGTVNVNALTFASSGYTIGATGQTLSFNGTTPAVATGTAGSLSTINAKLTGASVDLTGSGTISFGGGDDNSGFSMVANSGVTAILAKASTASVHAVGSGITIHAGGLAQLDGTGGDQIYQNSAVTLDGGTFDLNGKSESFDKLTGATGTVDNTAAGSATLTLGENNGSATFAGTLQNTGGALGLTKIGSGTATLSGINTYTGATNVNSGTLILQSSVATSSTGTNNTLPTGATVNIANGATLNLTNTVSGSSGSNQPTVNFNNFALNLNGGTSLTITTSNLTRYNLPGNITLTGNNTISVQPIRATLALSGVISGTGNLTFSATGSQNSHFLTLSNANTYTGSTGITAGNAGATILLVGGADRLPTTTPLTITGSSSNLAQLNLGGQNQTLAGLISAGTAGNDAVVNTGGGTPVLTLNQTSGVTTTFSGILGGVNAIPDAANNGQVSGNSFALTKSGAGTQVLNGANFYTGATAVNAGTLALTNIAALGATSGVTVANGATLLVDNGASTFTGNITISGSGVGGIGALNFGATGANSRFVSGSVTIANGDSAAFGSTRTGVGNIVNGITGGTIGSPVSLSKVGPGVLSWESANTYVGTVTVEAGALNLGSQAATPITGAVTVNPGATLALGRANNEIDDSADVTVNGTFDLSNETNTAFSF